MFRQPTRHSGAEGNEGMDWNQEINIQLRNFATRRKSNGELSGAFEKEENVTHWTNDENDNKYSLLESNLRKPWE